MSLIDDNLKTKSLLFELSCINQKITSPGPYRSTQRLLLDMHGPYNGKYSPVAVL
jgi:hypothetical protein